MCVTVHINIKIFPSYIYVLYDKNHSYNVHRVSQITRT